DYKGLKKAIRWVAFSPDGKLLAAATDSETRLWAPGNEKDKATFADSGPLVFSPNSRLLALVKHNKIRRDAIELWDVATGQRVATLPGYEDNIRAVAFSPDGKTLGSACRMFVLGDWTSEVRLWDVAMAKETAKFEARDEEPSSAAFSPDFKHLALATRESFLD